MMTWGKKEAPNQCEVFKPRRLKAPKKENATDAKNSCGKIRPWHLLDVLPSKNSFFDSQDFFITGKS
jgi:hypothetical protein